MLLYDCSIRDYYQPVVGQVNSENGKDLITGKLANGIHHVGNDIMPQNGGVLNTKLLSVQKTYID